jgi:hypothetical protein
LLQGHELSRPVKRPWAGVNLNGSPCPKQVIRCLPSHCTNVIVQ